MSGLLKGKNAIITGARRGIGRATVEVFAREGASIWACARSQDDAFEADMSEIADKFGVWIKPVYFDLADEHAIKNAIHTIQSEKLPVDILVNNAGIVKTSKSFFMTPTEQIREVIDINLISQITLTQYVSRLMVKKSIKGSIIFLTSIAGLDGDPAQLEYVASKSAIVGTVKKLVIELKDLGIRVNGIAPGITVTDMGNQMSERLIKETLDKSAMKRKGNPEEIANVIAFIASDFSSGINGQIVRVDGGM